eukprot:1155957-Pelagomonas_calceolata.AAC.2
MGNTLANSPRKIFLLPSALLLVPLVQARAKDRKRTCYLLEEFCFPTEFFFVRALDAGQSKGKDGHHHLFQRECLYR